MESLQIQDLIIDHPISLPSSGVSNLNNHSFTKYSKSGISHYVAGKLLEVQKSVPYACYNEGAKLGDSDCCFEFYKLYSTKNDDSEPDKEKAIYYICCTIGSMFLECREHSRELDILKKYVEKFGEKEVLDIVEKGIGDHKTSFDVARKYFKAMIEHIIHPDSEELKTAFKDITKKSGINKKKVYKYASMSANNQKELELSVNIFWFKDFLRESYKDYLQAYNQTLSLFGVSFTQTQVRVAVESLIYLIHQGRKCDYQLHAWFLELLEFCQLTTHLQPEKFTPQEADSLVVLKNFSGFAPLALAYLFLSGKIVRPNPRKAREYYEKYNREDYHPEKVEGLKEYLDLHVLNKLAKHFDDLKDSLAAKFASYAEKYENIQSNGHATLTNYFVAGYVQEYHLKDNATAKGLYQIGIEIAHDGSKEYFLERSAFLRRCQKRIKKLEGK